MEKNQREALINTRPGCYMGLYKRGNSPRESSIIFGQFHSYDPESKKIDFLNYLELDRSEYKVVEVNKKGGVHDVEDSKDIILGNNLVYSLGGSEKLEELLDALGQRYDPKKASEYKAELKAENGERNRIWKEEVRVSEASLGRPDSKERLARGIKNLWKIPTVSALYYINGFYPWREDFKISQRLDDLSGGKITTAYNDEFENTNSFATNVVNFASILITYAAGLTKVGSGEELQYVNNNPELVTIPSALFLASMLGASTESVRRVVTGIKSRYSDYKERKSNEIREERIRQAICTEKPDV